MKVLVTYFSQTGNTEQIARAIYEESVSSSSADLKKIEEIDPSQLDDYGLVIIGSLCHGGTLAEPVRVLMNLIPERSSFYLAGFVTHASPLYNKSDDENCMIYLSSLCRKKGIAYLGCFECQGRLAPKLYNFIKHFKHIPEDEWAPMAARMERHPDSEDIENARVFARAILNKIST